MSMSTPVKDAMHMMNLYGVRSIAEMGCGKCGILAQFHAQTKVGVDHFQPYLDEAHRLFPEIILFNSDVSLVEDFMPQTFDAIIAFDVLEHLEERRLSTFVQACELAARKLVIFFSPLDEAGLEMCPEDIDENPSMRHITIIRREYFRERGYKVLIYDHYWGVNQHAMLVIKEL
jgi:2-polyprenyl-3-methyl-5-hydroxy-6-metoxy-1,4-benzoquinol methylase